MRKSVIVKYPPMRFIYSKAFAIFSSCVLAVAFLVFLQVKGWLEPVRLAVLNSPRPVISLMKDVALPVKFFFSTIYQLHKITQENTQLKSKVAGLQQDLAGYEEAKKENSALKKELGFAQNSNLGLVPCSVLSQDPFGSDDAVILNCGLADGVAVGQAIISQGYLAGKIIYAGKHSSTAVLAISSDFSADAKVSQTSATAIVLGSFGSGLVLDQVPQTTDLQKGWLITTAGINAEIPKNILIGEVGDMLSGNSSLFKKATLMSPLDFRDLEFVFAVKQ